MPVSVMLQGFVMGLAYIAPIGMQNLFVIDSASARSRGGALRAVVPVILFDISLSLACFFGIGVAMDTVPWLSRVIQVLGGILVTAIGVGLILPKKNDATSDSSPVDDGARGVLKTVAMAFVVTWCNPQAIIDGTMMLGASRATFAASGGLFMMGVCLATLVWFPTLAVTVSALGNRLDRRVLRRINLICGIIVIIYGLRLLISFFSGI